jgi:hypothetical protein
VRQEFLPCRGAWYIRVNAWRGSSSSIERPEANKRICWLRRIRVPLLASIVENSELLNATITMDAKRV